jgi:hypothetical protein
MNPKNRPFLLRGAGIAVAGVGEKPKTVTTFDWLFSARAQLTSQRDLVNLMRA